VIRAGAAAAGMVSSVSIVTPVLNFSWRSYRDGKL
jgi:hypothetical protein